MNVVNDVLDFIFPKTCIISGSKLPDVNSNSYISDDELSLLLRPTNSDLTDLRNKLTADNCFSLFAFYENDNFSKIIYQLKYGGMKRLGILLGELLGKEFSNYFPEVNHYDYIIPVPLFKTKFRERGYNQSEFIGKGLSKILNVELRNDIIIRTRHTKSQTRLSKNERINNVKDAFNISTKSADSLREKKIILVDDVVTTGATLNEAISILRSGNCSEVTVLTAAMARD